MPRNVSGTYTLPLPPVVPNTTIESDWANETLADISQALTDSLDRTGRGGLTAPFRLVDGTAAQPGLAFNAETGTGLYRAAPGQMGVTVMGTAVGGFTADGFSGFVHQVDGDPVFTGLVTFGNGVVVTGVVESNHLLAKGPGASLAWWATDGPVDQRRYTAYGDTNGNWTFQAMDDANTVQQTYLTFRRNPALPPAGRGVPGWYVYQDLTIESGTLPAVLGLDAPSAISKAIQFRAGSLPRWNVEVVTAAGDFQVSSCTDDGAYVGPAFKLHRSSGLAEFPRGSVTFSGNASTGQPHTSVELRAVSETDGNFISGFKGGTLRWQMQLGDTGGSSNFVLSRYGLGGEHVGTPLVIDRYTGLATFENALQVNGTLQVGGNITTSNQLVSHSSIEIGHPSGSSTPFIDFRTTAGSDFDTRIIAYGKDLHFQQTGGSFWLNGPTFVSNATLTIQHGNLDIKHNAGGFPLIMLEAGSFRKFLRVNGNNNNYELVNAPNSAVIWAVEDSGRVWPGQGYVSKAGMNGAPGGNIWNYQWDGNVAIWIDTTRIGWINVSTSDERIKHSIAPMGLLPEAVFAKIQPIKFRWQNVGPFIDDGLDHWGFSAQNLLDYAPVAVKGSVTETGPNGEIYPANIDLMAILGQTILQLQALQARCTAAGI